MRFLLLCVSMALLAAGPARADWYQAKSRHFIIYGDASADELDAYAKKLERFDQTVRIARAMNDPALTDANRLTIYLLKSPHELARLNGSDWDGLLGLYEARASGSRAFVTKNKAEAKTDVNSDIVFFHEYAHHLMLQTSAAALPTWLVEGFAEFLSTAQINADGTVTLGAPAMHRAYGINSVHHDLPLTMMIRETYDGLSGWQEELMYSRGWLLTHYLTFEPSRRGQLDRYVAGIQKGMSSIDSAREAFGDLGQLDRELDSYADRKQLSAIVVRPDESKLGAVAIRPLSPAEAALIPVRIRSEYGVTRKIAPGVAARARKLAEPYPNDPFAQVTLAEAEFDAKDYEAADAAANRALAADPRNVRALIYKGEAQMKLAKAKGQGADWDQVRSWFLKANKADTENAEPLMLFYDTFEESGQQPTRNAVSGLLYAVDLVPQDRSLRIKAVRELLVENRIGDAKAMLAPIAYLPHGSNEAREALIKIMAAISAGDSKEALAIIDKERAEQAKDS